MDQATSSAAVASFSSLQLSEDTLVRLTSKFIPDTTSSGDLQPLKRGAKEHTLVLSPSLQAWRATLAIPNAPTGFGVYVGPRGASYVIHARAGKAFLRKTLGRTNAVSLQEAIARAQELVCAGTVTLNPYDAKLGEVIQGWMDREAARGQSPATRRATEAALKRWVRARMADWSLSDFDDANRLKKAFDHLRVQSAYESLVLPLAKGTFPPPRGDEPSNPVARRIKERGTTFLTEEDFRSLGLTTDVEKERVRNAGLSAAEECLKVARAAAAWWLDKKGRELLKKRGQAPMLLNPFTDPDAPKIRSLDEKRRARQRMRKGIDLKVDAKGDEKTQMHVFLEALHRRREETKVKGWRRHGGLISEPGPDYLLLTLFLGARRGETARLKWFDRLADVGSVADHSWVFLPTVMSDADHMQSDAPELTRYSGAHVYFHHTKNGRAHLLPLGPAAESLLVQRYLQRDRYSVDADRKVWVFPSYSPKSQSGHYKEPKTFLKTIQASLVKLRGEGVSLSPHDLRRTFITVARRSRKIQGVDISVLVNHKRGRDDGGEMTERYVGDDSLLENMAHDMATMEAELLVHHAELKKALKAVTKRHAPRR